MSQRIKNILRVTDESMKWSVCHIKTEHELVCSPTRPEASCTSAGKVHLCPRVVLFCILYWMAGLSQRERAPGLSKLACFCVNGASVPTGSVTPSMSITVWKATATQTSVSDRARRHWATAWENETPEPGTLSRRRGFSSVRAIHQRHFPQVQTWRSNSCFKSDISRTHTTRSF